MDKKLRCILLTIATLVFGFIGLGFQLVSTFNPNAGFSVTLLAFLFTSLGCLANMARMKQKKKSEDE